MTALHLLRHAPASDLRIDRTRHSHRFSLEYDDLESREVLSTILPAATTGDTGISPSTNAPGPVATASSPQTMLGHVATPGASSSVVTNSDGDVGSIQAQLTINSVPSNIASSTVSVVETPYALSVANSFPITALLPLSVTENETPLNNGTDISGTVWITPPPVTPGIFHNTITASPVFTNQYNQTVNPQGGPPSFTHLGQNANGSLSGAVTQQPVAVGPVGPSITEEVQPLQPPPVGAQQPVGSPTQLQQDQTTPKQDAQTPSGGTPGATQPGSSTLGPTTNQPSGSQTPAVQPAAPTGTPSQQPGNPAGQPDPRPAPNAGSAVSGGASGGTAYLTSPHTNRDPLDLDKTLNLIDASITSLASTPAPDVDQPPADAHLSAIVGATAVAVTGFHLLIKDARSARRGKTS